MRLLLVFIVNGEDVAVEMDPHVPLRAWRNKALADSKNTGRPPDDWEVRDLKGNLVTDLDKSVGEHGYEPNTRLFLTLKVGAGGARAN